MWIGNCLCEEIATFGGVCMCEHWVCSCHVTHSNRCAWCVHGVCMVCAYVYSGSTLLLSVYRYMCPATPPLVREHLVV